MRAVRHTILIGLFSIGIFGCAQPRPFDDLWVSPRPYTAALEAARPAADAFNRSRDLPELEEVAQPTGQITLRDAVRFALRQNHALRAQGWGVTAAEADAVQLGRPKNPTASFGVENFAGPDAGDTFLRQTLRISQVIELADKRRKRQALGEATQRMRAWDYEQARIDVASETARRYLAVVVAQKRVELAEQQLKLAKAGYAIAADRFKNEVAPGLEVDQWAVRVSLSKITLEKARQNLSAERADLAATWGSDEATFKDVVGELGAEVAMPGLDELKQRAGASPRIARWDDEIQKRLAEVDLERANAVTDPSVGGGVRYFSDADEYAGVFDINWPLPLWDDNGSAVLAARFRLAQARSQQEQARTEVNARLTREYARYKAAAYASRSFSEDALPAARSAYQAALESYKAGQSDYLTVLDAERSLLDIQNQHLDAQHDYQQAIIQTEAITAHALDAVEP
jgi:cobalt-zinc-cadmium efflux system outer membrane protein